MEVRILQSGDERAVETFLHPRVETSMFLIGNMRQAGLVDHGKPYQGRYAAAFAGERIVALIAHYWNGNLVVQAPAHIEEVVRTVVRESGRPVQGVIGTDTQVSIVKETLRIDESVIRLDEVEILFSLELANLVTPRILESGYVKGRRIEKRDIELVTQWTIAYSIEALKEQPGAQLENSCKDDVERALLEGRTWVLEQNGELLACSSFNTAIREAIQVGGVWTPPEFRRRGYGRAVVASSLLDAAREGVDKAVLFTSPDNIAAQRAYLACGFRQIGHYRLLLLKSALYPQI